MISKDKTDLSLALPCPPAAEEDEPAAEPEAQVHSNLQGTVHQIGGGKISKNCNVLENVSRLANLVGIVRRGVSQ